jgi:uncharacterized protein YbjT (DUF2867 family)
VSGAVEIHAAPGHIVVAGATGALGAKICERLRARGADVRPLSRPDADITAPGTLAALVEGASCVVSTATSFPRDATPGALDAIDRDGNIALVAAAERAGVPRFVFVSFKPVALDFPLQRAKRAVEERLADAGLDAVILRPGKFMDIWFSPLCGFDVEHRRATIFGDGSQPVTWIAAADVADVGAHAALGAGGGTIELGGPEALSQRDVVRIYEEVTGDAWALDSVPAEELEQQVTDGPDDVTRSLAAVSLECHLGSVTEAVELPAGLPRPRTTVRDFARRP